MRARGGDYSYLTDYSQYLEPVHGQADGSGNILIIENRPLGTNQAARIDTFSVQVNPWTATVPRFKVYKGKVAQTNFLFGIPDARVATLTSVNFVLRQNERLVYQIVNMDANQEIQIIALGQYLT